MSVATRVPDTAAAGEMLELYRRGEDLSLSGALADAVAHSSGRTYDLEAFAAAGRATSARQRRDPLSGVEGVTT
jgi:enoyl-CoA hydratase